jgi:hypothetical protein
MLDIELVLLVLLLYLLFSLLSTSILALKLAAFVTIVPEKGLLIGSYDFSDFDQFLLQRFNDPVFCSNVLIEFGDFL